MTWRERGIAAGAALALGAAGLLVGRASAPARVEQKVEYRDRIEYRDRVVTNTVQGPVRVVTKWQYAPASTPGARPTVQSVEQVEERGAVTTQVSSESQGLALVETKSSTKTTAQPRLLVVVDTQLHLGSRPDNLGAQVAVRIAGPAWLSVHAQRDEVRVGLGVTF